jgi:hypothetical protein
MKTLTIKIKYLAFTLVFAFSMSAAAFSQTIVAPIPARTPPKPPLPPEKRIDSEKSLAVDAKVNISLCVLEGNVKINGWERDEIRLFVKEGNPFEFKVRDKNKQNGKPVWITVFSLDSKSNKTSECFSGEEIEIDVPRNASVHLKGQETKTSIDSVRKASVKNIGGDIAFRNISEGVEASTYEGNVTVETSSGAFSLESLNGNIVAFELDPSEIGDIFKAKTSNGAIVLQNLEHRQIEVNSISGAISYNGAFSSGGLYSFGTSNGTIALLIPKETSCKFTATYGFGGFNSEIPFDKLTENKTPRLQNVVGTMGDGDATLNLTTSSGAIRIKSKKPPPKSN